MTKLARLIAEQEGFFVPGTLPRRDNNPGDLRHSPHSSHDPGAPEAIGHIDTEADGWSDLERQLDLYAGRLVCQDPVTAAPVPAHYMNLRDAVYEFAPPNENNSAAYLEFVLNGFGGVVDENTPLMRVLEIQA